LGSSSPFPHRARTTTSMDPSSLMSTQDVYRLVLILPHSRRLLATAEEGTPHLPRITVPGFSRVAEQLTRGIEQSWKVRSTVIDFLADESMPIPAVVFELRELEEEALRRSGLHSI